MIRATTISEALTAAAAIITEGGLSKGAYCEGACHCSVGAISVAITGNPLITVSNTVTIAQLDLYEDTRVAFSAHLLADGGATRDEEDLSPFGTITNWNDNDARTAGQVASAMTAAAKANA